MRLLKNKINLKFNMYKFNFAKKLNLNIIASALIPFILCSCLTPMNLEKKLNKYIGKNIKIINDPYYNDFSGINKVLKTIIIDENKKLIEYGFDKDYCKWDFIVDSKTDIILDWKYPDLRSKFQCEHLWYPDA